MPAIAQTAELRADHFKLITEARALNDKAKTEKRDLSAEELVQYDRMVDDADKLERRYLREEGIFEREERAKQSAGRRTEPNDLDRNPDIESRSDEHRNETPEDADSKRRRSPEYRSCFNQYIRYGEKALFSGQPETRALRMANDVQGGYLVAPQVFVKELIQDLNDQVAIRRLARTLPMIKAKSLGAPKRKSKMSTWGWGSELQGATADTSFQFGSRELVPHPATGEISVSRALLELSEMSPEQLIREEMARDRGELEENGFITGDGAGKPLGFMVASADGVSTGRDVSEGSTSTAVTGDSFVAAYYNLKQSHRRVAEWMLHRTLIKAARILKATTGDYLWMPGLAAGESETILGRPVNESEFMPNTMTTGLYVGMLANWKAGYWIADSLEMEIQTCLELAARTNQIVYIGRARVDGVPVLEEAFSRMKLA